MNQALDWTLFTQGMPTDGWNVLELAMVFSFLFLLGRLWFSQPCIGKRSPLFIEAPVRKPVAESPFSTSPFIKHYHRNALITQTEDSAWPSVQPAPAAGFAPPEPSFFWAGEASRS